MKRFKKILFFVLAFYIIAMGFMYFFQESILFFPQKLPADYQFHFNNDFEELSVTTSDSIVLNGLLFKTKAAKKGLVFFLHGNAGSLNGWGNVANVYTQLGYDVFMLDYRGFGKSGGSIDKMQKLFSDNQLFYNKLTKRYNKDDIIIIGYSLGTGLAAKLAADNHPKQLILHAPYYSIKDVMTHTYPVIPTFLLKYNIETYKYLRACNMPVTIFHGTNDPVIYYESSVKLKKLFPDKINLVTLKDQSHNGITQNPVYNVIIKELL